MLQNMFSMANTFVLLESTELPVSWQCSLTADKFQESSFAQGSNN